MMTPPTTKYSTGSRSGGVLVLALVLSCLTIGLCAGLVHLTYRGNASQGHASDAKEAFQVAEAGLAEAFAGLSQARTGNVGSVDEPARFGDGLFWVEARELDSGLVELECTGMVGSGRATLELHLRRAETQVGGLGFFSSEPLVLPADSFVDGYDSRLGSYADQVARGETTGRGLVGSNGDISLVGGLALDDGSGSTFDARVLFGAPSTPTLPTSTYVDGHATPGAEGQVTLSGDASVSGSTDARATGIDLPALVPPGSDPGTALVHSSATPLTLGAGDHAYESLTVGAGCEVVLTGPSTLTVDRLSAAAGSRVLLDTATGAVDLIVTGSLAFDPLSSFETSTQDPTRASLLVSAEDDGLLPAVDIDAFSSFHGLIHAPDATVVLGSDFEVFGAVVANELRLAPSARLHFDHALADPGLDGTNRTRLVSWRVVDLPLEVNNRALSPFALLGVDRSALPLPAAAHLDQWLVIEFVDHDGLDQTYEGWESAFQWGKVADVKTATRDSVDALNATQLEVAAFTSLSSVDGTTPIADMTIMDLMTALRDPTSTSEFLRDLALHFSPLPSFGTSLAARTNDMEPQHVTEVMLAQDSVPDEDLQHLITNGVTGGTDLITLLQRNSPLAAETLMLVLDGTANLSAAEQLLVLGSQ